MRRRAMGSVTRLFFWVWVCLCPAEGHVVKQIYGEILAASGGGWEANITMDAGYAWPATRQDADAPQPSLGWLEARSETEFATLRREAQELLVQKLRIEQQVAGSALFAIAPCTYHFPDFQGSPPKFPKLPGRYAFLTVRITGEAGTGRLRITELTGQNPYFLFKTGAAFQILPAGGEITLSLSPEATVTTASRPAALARQIAHFIWEGFRHVLPLGWDHLLFILALFLHDRRLRAVTHASLVFTLAHSITLGLAWAGAIQAGGNWVEPVIAFSIALAAGQNLWQARVVKGLTATKAPALPVLRWGLIFGLGLVHGLGFSGALSALAASDAPWLLVLAAANIGVELAQIAVLGTLGVVFWKLPAAPSQLALLNVCLVIVGLAVAVWRVADGN